MNEKLTLDLAINRLSVHPEFAYILNQVKSLREENIGAMFNASSEALQQIAGQILAYDQMLKITDADRIIMRHQHVFLD
jgi:hypothetical protein